MHPKGAFCPAWAALVSISAGPEDAADRVRQSASCCQSRTGLKVESKSKRSQSRRGIPCIKVEWFCAKKSPAKSNWVYIMYFCFTIRVYTPCFWPFRMQYCCKQEHSSQSRTGFRGLRLIKSNGFEVELVWKSGDFLKLCIFVALFWYNPRVFDHFTWIFVSIDGFGGGIIIRV